MFYWGGARSPPDPLWGRLALQGLALHLSGQGLPAPVARFASKPLGNFYNKVISEALAVCKISSGVRPLGRGGRAPYSITRAHSTCNYEGLLRSPE